MSVQNLATVFGPNILRPHIEDPVTIMEGRLFVFLTAPVQMLDVCVIYGDNTLENMETTANVTNLETSKLQNTKPQSSHENVLH